MAEILPVSSVLPTIMEGQNFSFTFEYQLESDEILEEIKIVSSNMPESINIVGPTFSGNFSGLFQLPTNSLKYREGDELKAVSSFAQLPPKGTVDLYSYTGPGDMIKNYTLSVRLTYLKGLPGAEESLNITKQYTQPVRGNREAFTNLFLEYIN